MPYDFKSLLFSVIITLVAYGTFPILLAKTRKKAITKTGYSFLCFFINFFIMLIFFVFNNNSSTGAPYILWTIAFSSLGRHILKDKYILVTNRKHICPKCKAPLQPNRKGALWCSSCGFISQFAKGSKGSPSESDINPPVVSGWKCGCGRVHPKHVSTCVCGKSKDDSINEYKPAVSDSKPSVIAAEDAEPETNKIHFCYNCGTRLVDDGVYCSNCGTKIIRE